MIHSMLKQQISPLYKVFLIVIALSAVLSISGCNTVAGIGKDIRAVGQSIEKTAKKSKKY